MKKIDSKNICTPTLCWAWPWHQGREVNRRSTATNPLRKPALLWGESDHELISRMYSPANGDKCYGGGGGGGDKTGWKSCNSCRSCSFEQRCHLSKALEQGRTRPGKRPGERKPRALEMELTWWTKANCAKNQLIREEGTWPHRDDPPHHLFRERRTQVRPK